MSDALANQRGAWALGILFGAAAVHAHETSLGLYGWVDTDRLNKWIQRK